jgi:hypothetical protein
VSEVRRNLEITIVLTESEANTLFEIVRDSNKLWVLFDQLAEALHDG